MSSAIHAPCCHDVMTGISRVLSVQVYEPREFHCKAGDYPVCGIPTVSILYLLVKGKRSLGLLLRNFGTNFTMGQAGGNFVA